VIKRLDVAEKDRCCSDCSSKMVLIGEDITERGEVIPAKIVVHRYLRLKYACPNGHGVKMRDLPPSLIDKAKYEISTYAHVATAKYCDHVPLHRLAGIFKRRGVKIAKSTMWDMLVRVDEIAAQAILAQMLKEICEGRIIHADETPVTTRLEGKKGTKKSYIWVYTSGEKTVFDFTMSRGRDGPSRMLRDWQGTLVADAYGGYDQIVTRNDIIRAGCWSHARRKLKDAMDTGSKSAALVLFHVQRLFRIEKGLRERAKARGLSAAESDQLRLEIRSKRSARVIETIFETIDELNAQRATLPKSALGKALSYITNQRVPLTRFLDDGALDIQNNAAERALRPIALGRNNWLIFGSRRGGEVASRLYSLIYSCKALGIDPEAYLVDILGRVATTPSSKIASLTPWAWAKNQAATLEAQD
jgi:transposase